MVWAVVFAVIVSAASTAAAFLWTHFGPGELLNLAHGPFLGVYGLIFARLVAPDQRVGLALVLTIAGAFLAPGIVVLESLSYAPISNTPTVTVRFALSMYLAVFVLILAYGVRSALGQNWAFLPISVGAVAAAGIALVGPPSGLDPNMPALLLLPVHLCLAWTLAAAVAIRGPIPGHCQSCGYDLAGLQKGVCPECGEDIPAERERSDSERASVDPETVLGPKNRACLYLGHAFGSVLVVISLLGWSGDFDDAQHFFFVGGATLCGLILAMMQPGRRRWIVGSACTLSGVLLLVMSIAFRGYLESFADSGHGSGITWMSAMLLVVAAVIVSVPALCAARTWRALLATAIALDASIALGLALWYTGLFGAAYLDPVLTPVCLTLFVSSWCLVAHAIIARTNIEALLSKTSG